LRDRRHASLPRRTESVWCRRLGNEGPRIAQAGVALLWRGVLVLLADKALNLINLDPTAPQASHFLVVELGTSFPHSNAEAHDRVPVDTGDPFDASDAAALAQWQKKGSWLVDWLILDYLKRRDVGQPPRAAWPSNV